MLIDSCLFVFFIFFLRQSFLGSTLTQRRTGISPSKVPFLALLLLRPKSLLQGLPNPLPLRYIIIIILYSIQSLIGKQWFSSLRRNDLVVRTFYVESRVTTLPVCLFEYVLAIGQANNK